MRAGDAGVGSGAYRAPPTVEGAVEMAYGVDPYHRGRGYAPEAARALVVIAFGSGMVRLVRAHTRPGHGASARVLRQ